MAQHVAGLDLSLTHTGVAVLRTDTERPRLASVLSSPMKTAERDGAPYAGLLDRRNRIQSIAARTVRHATDGLTEDDDAPLFVIEAPLYGAAPAGSAAMWDRMWLFGLVTHTLFKRGLVVEVSTTTLKRYATGSGGSGRNRAANTKTPVLAALPRMFPAEFVDDDNEADALVLAAMGARHLGWAREPSPQRVNPAALDSVLWPTRIQRRAVEPDQP